MKTPMILDHKYGTVEFLANIELEKLLNDARNGITIHVADHNSAARVYFSRYYLHEGRIIPENEYLMSNSTSATVDMASLRDRSILLVEHLGDGNPDNYQTCAVLGYSFHVGLDVHTDGFLDSVHKRLNSPIPVEIPATVYEALPEVDEIPGEPSRPFLNHFYSIEGFLSLSQALPILQWERIFDLYVPTARVSTTPEIHMPRVARAYSTSHYWCSGKIMSYDEVHAKRIKEFGQFRGISHEEAVYLFEYWEDDGSDGHIDYRHKGYIFSTLAFPDRVYPVEPLRDIYNRG